MIQGTDVFSFALWTFSMQDDFRVTDPIATCDAHFFRKLEGNLGGIKAFNRVAMVADKMRMTMRAFPGQMIAHRIPPGAVVRLDAMHNFLIHKRVERAIDGHRVGVGGKLSEHLGHA